MKQTATNYLIEQLSLKAMAEHIPWVLKILDTAIEMEKEQKGYSKEDVIIMISKYIEDNLDPSTHGNIENVKEWFKTTKQQEQ
jgi:hypothetical protein